MSKISTNELARYAVEQLEAGSKVQDLASKIAAFLLEERRSREMPAVIRKIDVELSRRGNDQVTVTSAHPLSQEVKDQLSVLLAVKNPVFNEIIDSSVIGGVKARSGETEIDLTIRGKLNKFKTVIVGEV